MELGRRAQQLARELPRETRRLLGDHVHSAGELDLLLLLHEDRARIWRAEEICDVLRCPPAWAAVHLRTLREAGLLAERDGGYVCSPVRRELDEALDALEDARRTHWAELAELIAAPGGRRRRALTEGPTA
jgi:hypothetical protein